ncbi:MAG TPA: glycosyltransferase 87 family protein, partial [Gemmatales bacterium]|nr:glycosyltransferase 87 family protein [Gemmatales bacterium]
AACWWGWAAAMKATPLLWCLFLLWKRCYLAAIVVLLVAVGFNLLPDLLSTSPTASSWLVGWWNSYISQILNASYTPADWGTFIYNNQSLAGMLHRLLDTTPLVEKLLGLLMAGALLVAAGLAMERTVPEKHKLPVVAMEFSMVLLLMLLFSPMSGKSHFVVLLLPGMVVARQAWWSGSYLLGSILLGANILGMLALNWWDKPFSVAAMYASVITMKTLLLYLACLISRFRVMEASQPCWQERSAPSLSYQT